MTLNVHLVLKSRMHADLPLSLCGVMINHRVNYCTLYTILIKSVNVRITGNIMNGFCA